MDRMVKLIGVVGLLFIGQARAGEWPAAAQVLKETGVSAGLAVVVGTTDGKLEADLTRGGADKAAWVREQTVAEFIGGLDRDGKPRTWNYQRIADQEPAAAGRMLVHGLALSDEALHAARQHLLDRKLYGLASIERIASAKTLPYYDRIVNLLVADLDALGAEAPAMAEIQRVLAFQGTAYLKQGGKWGKAVKPTPADVDVWATNDYGPAFNGVSRDRLAGPPNAMRWLAAPFAVERTGFRISDHTVVRLDRAYEYPTRGGPRQRLALWAVDAHSGVPLWSRVVQPSVFGTSPWPYNNSVSQYDSPETFLAAEGRVYCLDTTGEDRAVLKSWDIRTGEEKVVFDQGFVYRRQDYTPPDNLPKVKQKPDDWRLEAARKFYASVVVVDRGTVVHSTGERLYVMDAATGKLRWSKEHAAKGGSRAMIAGDRLFAVTWRQLPLPPDVRESDGKRALSPFDAVEAFRLADGQSLWRFTDFDGMTHFLDRGRPGRHAPIGVHGAYLLINGDRYRCLCLEAATGRKVWEIKAESMHWGWGALFGYKDRFWAPTHTPAAFVYDMLTGKRLGKISSLRNGQACGTSAATPRYVISQYHFIPIGDDVMPLCDPFDWYRQEIIGMSCNHRLTPAYGAIHTASTTCLCNPSLQGSTSFAPLAPVIPVADGQRLLPGGLKAHGGVEPQSEALRGPAAFAWVVPESVNHLFGVPYLSKSPAGSALKHGRAPIAGYDRAQTPAVEHGGLKLVAHGPEHRLEASRDGKPVWNFIAGGRIGCAPVVHQGLAIFGCHDGYVYAVKLTDGSLAWRFLAAPADRRHVFIGQLESAWPVFNVALDSGRLYCSAGRFEQLDGGIHFYGLDPATGKMHWHIRRQVGLSTEDGFRAHGLVPGAERTSGLRDGRPVLNNALAVKDGKLWLLELPVVDLAAPRDVILNHDTLVPPDLAIKADAAKLDESLAVLSGPNPLLRADAARALGRLGDKAKPAAPALVKALGDIDPLVRRAAALALGEIGAAESHAAALHAAMADRNETVRRAAVEAIVKAGPAGVPALVKLLERDDAAMNLATVRALVRLQWKPDAASLPALLRAFEAEVEEGRACYRRCLLPLPPLSEAKSLPEWMVDQPATRPGKGRSVLQIKTILPAETHTPALLAGLGGPAATELARRVKGSDAMFRHYVGLALKQFAPDQARPLAEALTPAGR